MAEMSKLRVIVDSFCVLGQFFGGKGKIIGGFWELWELAFRMYVYQGKFSFGQF